MPYYYDFGEKSAGLIGLLLTSDGQLTAFAYQRPPPGASLPPMTEIFRSQPLTLGQVGIIPFRLSLAATKVGLLSLEPRGWPSAYEVNRAHFLGMLSPYGMDEIPYQDFGGINRSGGVVANRVFDGVFSYNPAATDPKQVATLTLTDVESGGQSVDWVSISSLDDNANQVAGGVLVAVRVNEANRGPACATLALTGGHTVDVPGLGARSQLTLDC